jgi:[ribosomal protein S5]-alanine N-acetyltransferase
LSDAKPVCPVLKTDRLRLRPMLGSDAASLHALFGDTETMRYMDHPVSRGIGDTTSKVQCLTIALPEWHHAWVVLQKDSETPIGMVNYHHRESWNRRLEIGFILARPYWRQGLMSEALGALLAYCFDDLAIHRIEMTIDPQNQASIRCAERMGFRCEGGPLRDRAFVAGEYRDLMMYALLRNEWARAGTRHQSGGERTPLRELAIPAR